MFKKIVLDNGLRVITVPMQGTNTVTVLILCATGSDYEPKRVNGVSHFLEHMFFKGTARRPGPDLVSQELDGMGSMHNAFTSHEVTGYFIKAGKGYWQNSLDLLADIYRNSLLKEEEIEREKQVVVEEIHLDKDTPTTYIWWVWERLLYGDQPAGRDVAGEEKIIRALTRNDFMDYFHGQYVALNTAVVIAGNFDEPEAVEKISALFDDSRDEPPLHKKPIIVEEQFAPAVHVEYKETDQAHLVIGFRGYDANHPKRYAAEVLGVLLGGGMSSRMFTRIRERLGLAYSVWSAHESYSNRGFLTTYAGVAHENLEKTIRAALEEYQKVISETVDRKELQRVKDYIRGTTSIALEQSNAVANFVGTEEMVTGKPLTVDEVFAKIEAVSPEDLLTVGTELIRPERLNLALIGPCKEKDRLETLLKKF